MASSNFSRRNLIAFNSCISKLLLILIVFSIIDDFAHILPPNSPMEQQNSIFKNNHLTSSSCLNCNRRNEVKTTATTSSSTQIKSFFSSYTLFPSLCSRTSFSSSSSSSSQITTTTNCLQPADYQSKPTKQLSCGTSMLFNSLINNSLRRRSDNDAINNKPLEIYCITKTEDKSQSGTTLGVSLMKHYLSYILFTLKKLAISSKWITYPRIVKVSAIRLIRLDVPLSIQAGQPLRLKCLYDTKGEKLQSLSWYKNGREFYRFQPFERKQPVLAFKLNGVHVDLSKSRNSTVILTNTTSETSGRYKCEATGTTFQEVNMESYVNVLSAPQSANSVTHPTAILKHILGFVMVTTFFIQLHYRFDFQIE